MIKAANNGWHLLVLAGAAPFLMGAVGPMSNLNDRLLAAHNRERAAVGVPPLKWNEGLAASAGSWAQHLEEFRKRVPSSKPTNRPARSLLTAAFYEGLT